MRFEVGRRTLGEIADITMGQSPKGETCNPDGIGSPLLNGPTEFGFRHPEPVQFTTDPKRFAEPGDLLFCVRGSTTGRMNWANRRYAIGRGIAGIRGKSGYPTSYVRALIEHQLDSLLQSATGSTFPNVSRRMLTSLPVPAHDAPTAVRISEILDVFEDRMWTLSKKNSTLESIAQATFKSWFIDFDPVHAKAAGQEPIGMDAETAALFPSEFEDSELGSIPKGWRWGKFENALELAYGKSLRADRRIPGPVTVMGSNGPVGTHNEKLVSGPGIVVGRKGNAGTVQWVDEDFFPIDTTFYVVPKSDLPLSFLYFSLEVADLRSLSADSAVPGLNRSFAYSCPVLVPSKEIVMVFGGLFSLLRSKVAENIGLMNTLTALRDTLLPRLISGKLRIPEAEEIVEEAVS